MRNKFPVSFLSIMAFCEVQLYLREAMGIKVISKRMTEGIREHEKVNRDLIPERTMTLNDAFEISIRDGISMRAREVFTTGKFLYGYMDELIIMPGAMIVIEDKTSHMAGKGSILQVLGYCMTLSERFPRCNLFWAVRKIPDMKILKMGTFKSGDYSKVLKKIRRIREILIEKNPEFHGNRKKCLLCNLNKVCRFFH